MREKEEWSVDTRQRSAREILQAVSEVKNQAVRLSQRIELLENKCTNITARYGGQAGGVQEHNELWNILSDERARLTEQLRLVMAMERQVSEWIDLLPREAWRMVLRLRYLDGLSFQEVTAEMSRAARRPYSMSQIYRFHRLALEAADRLWPRED